jgi:hypothetical protein
MTTAPPPPREEDDEPPAVSDAVWDEFVRDNRSRIRATAPKEPSARARMVTERLRREDEAAAERERRSKPWWRRRAKEPAKWEPDGWRTGPAWREMQRGERRAWHKGVRTLAVVVAVAVVTLVALNPSGVRSLAEGHGFTSHDSEAQDGADTDGAPLAPETAAPTAAPSADPDIPDVDHPWAGSPALRWADGEAGIVLPKAEAVGKVTAAQVAAALRTTKAYLAATNLDPAVLRGGYPAAALRLADPVNGRPAQIKAALRSPSTRTIAYVTRYDPGDAEPVGTVVKVRGRMTFAEAEYDSVRVRSDFTFVYAFAQPGHSDGTVRRLVVRRVLDTYWLPRSAPGKVQIGSSDTNLAGAECDYSDGFLHFDFGDDAPSVVPSGPATDPYDRSRQLSTSDTCGVASRV